MVEFYNPKSFSLAVLKLLKIQPNWTDFCSLAFPKASKIVSNSTILSCSSISMTSMSRIDNHKTFQPKPMNFDRNVTELSPATIQILAQIYKQGPSPDIVTYTTYIKFLGDSGYATEAYELFEVMIESHEPDAISFTVLIQILCNSRMFDAALDLLHEMAWYNCKPDIFCYNTLIDKFGEMGLEEHVWKFWYRMKKDGIDPDIVTYSSLVKALCVSNKIGEALEVLRFMEATRKVQPNTYTYNTLIKTYLGQKRIKEALGVLGRMEIRGCNPDLCTFNLFIKYYSDLDEGKEAYKFLKCMIRREIEARESSYRICFNGLMNIGAVNEVMELIESIKALGVTLNVCAWNKLIVWLSKVGHFDEAYRLFLELEEPDEITMNILIQLLFKQGKTDKAWEIFQLMKEKGIEASVVTYNILINGLGKEGMVSKAFELVNQMESEEQLSPDLITYNCLLDGLCKNREIDEACKVILEMLKRDIKPDLISYNTLINGLISVARYDDASRLFEHMKENLAAHSLPLQILVEEMLSRDQLM